MRENESSCLICILPYISFCPCIFLILNITHKLYASFTCSGHTFCYVNVNGRGKTKPAHHNKLKPYEGDKAPRWVLKSKRQISSRRGNRV